MSVIIKSRQVKFRNTGSEDYHGISAISEEKTADMLKQIEDKGQEVRDSIPDDYNTLAQEVDDLKNNLNQISQREELDGWVEGKYISTSGATVNPLTPTNDNGYRYLYIEALENDIFTINATGGNSPRTWAFIDSSNNVLLKSLGNLVCNNDIVTAPQNSAYLIINDKKTNGICYKGKGITQKIVDLEYKGDILTSIASSKENMDLVNATTWELGLISNLTGKATSSTSRICTPSFINIKGLSTIFYTLFFGSVGVQFAFYSEQNEDSWIESTTEWLSGSGVLEVKGNYIRLTMSTNNVANAKNLCAFAYNPIIEGISSKNIANRYPIHGIAHMGNAGNVYNDPPAQTDLNYINASNKGYKFVEGDIRFTADGVAILNHDNDVSNSYTWYYAGTDTRVSTAGEVLISQKTYTELRDNYDIRRAAGNYITKVLKFDDWIVICRDLDIYPYIELKTDANYTAEQITSLVDITKMYKMENNCAWFAETTNILNMILSNHQCARIGYAPTNDSDTTKIATAKSLKKPYNEVWVQYQYTNITNEIIEEAKEAGIPLIVWTVDTEEDMLSLDNYIMGVLSNTLDYSIVRKNTLLAKLT